MLSKEDQPAYYSDEEKKTKQPASGATKAGFASANLTGWKDFFLKPQLIRALKQAGFEHPSEVQQECIPCAVQGHDILCQAKSGMGKTAVFALSILNQLAPQEESKEVKEDKDRSCTCIVISHTRQLAYQIQKDFKRFGNFIEGIHCTVVYGGVPIQQNIQEIQKKKSQIIVGTPGRLVALTEKNKLKLENVKYFVIDECDQVLGNPKMRIDVQSIFLKTPKQKQVMMFSATMNDEIKKGGLITRLSTVPSRANGNLH